VVSPQQFRKVAINYMTHPIHYAALVCFDPRGVGRQCPAYRWRFPPPSARLARTRAPSERATPCRDGDCPPPVVLQGGLSSCEAHRFTSLLKVSRWVTAQRGA
jgi:hypothetical protein